jgi:hypothetical protein
MGLEAGTYISDLVVTNPVGASDAKSQGDDHLRLIKATIKNTFPNITGAMTLTHTQLNLAALKNAANVFTEAQDITKAGGSTLRLNGTGNNGIEIGRTDGVASTAHIDFHSGTDGTNDYDVRMVATGGNTSDGQGTLNVIAAALQVNGTPVVTSAPDAFPAGTRMVFQQTSAPSGWTKETVHNNKALRLVTGTASTGGTVAFDTAFASKSVAGTINNVTVTGTVQNHTLTIAQLPAHDHGATGLTFTGNALPGHSHSINLRSNPVAGNSVQSSNGGSTTGTGNTDSASAGTPSGSIGGTTASTGSGSGHNHGLVMDSHGHTFTGTAINLDVQYVDFIIGVKN